MTEFVYPDSELQLNTQFVLCLEEHDYYENNNNDIDTRLFIGYNQIDDKYYVRGKREGKLFVPYAFSCDSKNVLYNFIDRVFDFDCRLNLILYNFNNLTELNPNKLSYEFFENNMDKHYEVAGYNNISLDMAAIKIYLDIIKNITRNRCLL